MAISHVDEDHITGVLDLFALLQDQRTNGDAELIGVDGLWHNSFSEAIDPDDEIQPQFNALVGRAASPRPPRRRRYSASAKVIACGSSLYSSGFR